MELAFGHRALAEEAGGDSRATLHAVREREADGEREACSHDRVAAVESGGGVEHVHRATAAAAAALDLAEHLRHEPARVDSARQRMAVLAIGGHDRVVRRETLQRADGHGLLADVEVQEAADLALAVLLRARLLEAPDAHHPAQEPQRVVAVAWREERVRRHGLSSVEVSPSGSPSSRARSSRRRIFPLRVLGTPSRTSSSFGATAAPSRVRAKPRISRVSAGLAE